MARRSTSFWGAAACAITAGLLWPAPASALTIVPDYTSIGGTALQATQAEAAFNVVIAQYEAMFSNAITLHIALQLQNSTNFLGENTSPQPTEPYITFQTDLHAQSGNGPAQIATGTGGSVPAGTTDPILGNANIQLSQADAKALGFTKNGNGASFSASDTTIFVTTAIFPFAGSPSVQFARVDGQVGTESYDFTSVVSHEFDEALGLGSTLACSTNPCSSATPAIVKPEDLFRYNLAGARDFTFSPTDSVFLSINGGASDLVQLSQDPDGDFGDFFSPGNGTAQDMNAPCTSHPQNAFSCNGQIGNVTTSSPEAVTLEAMGYMPRFSSAAPNTIWQVDCSANTIASTGVVTTAATPVTAPLAALLGAPTHAATFASQPKSGDLIEIINICTEDVTVTTSGLTLTNSTGVNGLSDQDVDGIQGQLEISGAQGIVVTGLLLGNFSTSFSFASASDVAVLFIHDGATATILHTDIVNSPSTGILVRRGAEAVFLDDRLFFNGFNTAADNIDVLSNSKAMLGADDGSLSVLVEGAGGDGISVQTGSSVLIHAAQLTFNGNRQLSVLSSGSARLSSSNVTVDLVSCQHTHGVTCGNAIEVAGSSKLLLEGGVSIATADSSATTPSGAIVLSQGSALLTQGASIIAPSTASGPPTVKADTNSVVALAGGNSICSQVCSSASTGTVFEIDHVSSLLQVAPGDFGYAAAHDTVFGNGLVQLQSTVDLGQGAASQLTWTTAGGAGVVVVEQNSSVRLQGGVAITGKVQMTQGSNAFFNTVNGTNTITNGASSGLTCPFVAIPAAHVVIGSGALTPLPALAVNFVSATTPQCLPF